MMLISTSKAQKTDFWNVNFDKADSVAFRYHGFSLKHPETLADSLTRNLPTDVEKFRAIFRWIADNVSYDYPLYLKILEREVKFQNDIKKMSEFTTRSSKKRLRHLIFQKKAICSGYATLLDYMCSKVGLESAFIGGYSRTYFSERRHRPDHAWNAVKLDDKWYLCDVTWASGFIHPDAKKFFKKYSDLYFLTDPSLFVCSHFPADKSWLFLKDAPSLDEFYRSPYRGGGFIENKINTYFPSTKIVRLKMADQFQLRFTSNSDKVDAYASLVTFDKRGARIQKAIRLQRNEMGEYMLETSFNEKWTYDVYISINGDVTFGYQIVVQ